MNNLKHIGRITNTNKKCIVTLDDQNPGSNFHMGQIDAVNSSYTIQFNLKTVANGPYRLAIHSYLDQCPCRHLLFDS